MPVAPAAIFGLPEWAARLTLAGLVVIGALVLLAAIGWAVPRLVRRADPAVARSRQRATAIAVLASSLRLVVLVAAAIGVAGALAGGGGLAAVGGGALVVLLVGFASQRLLVDVIAGFFILFEAQYGVGDVVRLEPSGYTGRVVVLSLRQTTLTGSGGERMVVPNGQITAVRVIPGDRRTYRLEVLTRDPAGVEALLRELAGGVAGAGGPWDGPPRIVSRPLGDGLTRLVAVLAVDPVREAAAATWLPEALAARAGDMLAAPPLATVDA